MMILKTTYERHCYDDNNSSVWPNEISHVEPTGKYRFIDNEEMQIEAIVTSDRFYGNDWFAKKERLWLSEYNITFKEVIIDEHECKRNNNANK